MNAVNAFTTLAASGAIAFALAAALGWPAILLLRRLSFRQKAYEDAPQSHATKTSWASRSAATAGSAPAQNSP